MREKGVIRIGGLAAFTLLKGFFGSFLNGASQVKSQEQEEVLPVKRSTPTVLVIDDDRKYLETVRELLIGTGFGVLTSTSGAKGLDIMRYYQGDLQVMVLDYSMPRLNGAETLKYVRRLNSQIKVIAVIDVDIDSLPVSFREGVQGIVAKPVKGADLIGTINVLLKDGLAPPAPGLAVLPAAAGAVG